MDQSQPLFVYFRYFLDTISIIQIEKSVDGVLGNQTWGCRMVGADKTTELWRYNCLCWSDQDTRFGYNIPSNLNLKYFKIIYNFLTFY